ncbi:reverse transcriptase domain-containing protein, partial [Tanacetum coccineum]
MYTRGRKKAEAKPAPLARDPRDVETIEKEAETEPNVWDDEPVDVNPFGGRKHSLGLKIEILEFTGKVHPDDFIDRLSTVERVFDVRDIPEKLKVKLVAIKLRQHASLWWDHVNKRRQIKGKSKVKTWEKIKKLMKAKFLPENHRQEAFLDYHNLSQQNMTVEEVINEFDKLRMRCDVVEEEEQVIARFLGVLKPEIADIVSLQPYWTYTDVCRLALKVEKHIKAKSKGSTSRFTPPTRIAPPTAPKTAPKATTPTTSAACNTRERVDNAPHCYKCGGLGHYARDCLNLKTLALVPDDAGLIYDTDVKPEVDEPGDELVYPDHGEALVIQRVLNVAVSKSVDDNSWLRNNIFRTKYTFKGKIYDMIIDGGSCENVVSTYMVEKLGMKTEDHPKPYHYKDKVWSEVIPMDAAHILLGRPWQFDRKTKHDGFQNTYIFKKDGVNITLVPFDSRQTQEEGSNLFMKKTGFEGLMKTSPYVFTLVVVEENKIISEAPLQVQSLLREFANVIPDDIPPGLPAMRDIQHCIDFIPGSAIPDRPAYQMNPKEFRCDLEMNGRQLSKLEMDYTSGWLCPSDCLSSLEQHLSHLRQIFSILRAHKLYANGKKCHFLVTEVTFLGYIVTGSAIKIDPAKVEAIISWPTPSTIHDIRSFHSEASKAFDILKAKVTEAPVLALPNFDEVFQVKCDASGVGIGGVLSQNQRPIALFSEKLNDERRARLCIPLCSLREAIILEGREGGLAGHFGRDKTLALLREQFNWPRMERDVNRLLERCRTCHIAKTISSNAGLYTPLSVPVAPWEDVSLDFVLEIVKLHGVPKMLTSDRDVKFLKVVNRNLGNLLSSLIRDNAKQWDLILPQAEFAYNWSVNRTTSKSPFEVVYGRNPITPLDLVPVPEVGQFSKEEADQSEQIKELHRSIHLCKERFLAGRFGMLKPRGDGPFRILKKINDNAYKIELPGHYNVSATFNVADLSPYKGDSDDEPDSGLSLFQEGEDDADMVNELVNV